MMSTEEAARVAYKVFDLTFWLKLYDAYRAEQFRRLRECPR